MKRLSVLVVVLCIVAISGDVEAAARQSSPRTGVELEVFPQVLLGSGLCLAPDAPDPHPNRLLPTLDAAIDDECRCFGLGLYYIKFCPASPTVPTRFPSQASQASQASPQPARPEARPEARRGRNR